MHTHGIIQKYRTDREGLTGGPSKVPPGCCGIEICDVVEQKFVPLSCFTERECVWFSPEGHGHVLSYQN
jgi:hypothetical protein